MEKQLEINRKEIAKLILIQLEKHVIALKDQFGQTKNTIGFFYLDELLPRELALQIFKSFPKTEETVLRKSLKEHKYTAYQMDKYHPILEEILYAFQEENVVRKVSEICDLKDVFADKSLYAGGLSIMKKDNFLKPHIDNSHDKNVKNWRVLNLLYYVTPDWKNKNGGNLELWLKGLNSHATEITSKFNRLVVMATHQKSWHSVNQVLVNKQRCCVSNYYFSKNPNFSGQQFHVTSFRGRPKETILDLFLKLDNKVRMSIRKIFKKGVRENPHEYKNKNL